METLSAPETTTPGTGDGTLAQILREAAAAHGERCAIASETGDLTYRQLDERVRHLAEALREAGVDDTGAVAIYLPRSADAIVAIHAVTAAGAVVAPLDVVDPSTRTRELVRQAALTHAVIAVESIDSGPFEDAQIRTLDDRLALATFVSTGPSPWVADHGRAREPGGYLLFTSGSTGTPKGVLLAGGAVAHFVRWAAARLDLGVGDRVAAQAALTFDLSTFDIFATALSGSTAVLMPEWLKAFPADTLDWLTDNEITVLYAVPTLLRGLVAAMTAAGRTVWSLRAVAFAGEPYPPGALQDLLHTLDHTAVHNWYGPTETNVCTGADMRAWRPDQPVPVGTAIDGVSTCLVDGELVVAGPTLLTGYVIDGALVDPTMQVRFPDGIRRRAYRTGDRARIDDAGRLILGGRVDDQIKRHGYRIDLAGIETIAVTAAGLLGAAAVTTGGDNRITLFVDVGAPANSPAAAAAVSTVDAALRERLPVTAQPDDIRSYSPLPINRRGKVDRTKLAEIAADEENR